MQPKRRSFLLVSILLLTWSVPTGANFFSRLLKRNTDDSGSAKPAPASAATSMGSRGEVGGLISFEDGIPLAHLANNNRIPLVGLGSGNLQRNAIPRMIAEAIQEDKRTRLIDASHGSRNEALVALGISEGVRQLNSKQQDGNKKVEVHVVTKVWYTHLGYERTKRSVEDSLAAFKPALENENIDLKLHVLLHWPRCYDKIPWMNCEEEELKLADHIRELGPNPSKDPENAWKESWRSLEDLYSSDEHPIASIGVANFHLHDIELMDTFARIHPHILQVNLWSLIYDPLLVEYCHKHKIHVQAFNALHSTVRKPETAPHAFHHLQKIAIDLSSKMNEDVTAAQIILAWLIQHGVSVIPGTTKLEHLKDNSAVALSNFPGYTDHEVETVAHAVEAFLSGNDMDEDIHVTVTFHADTQDMVLYWMGHNDGEETRVKLLRKGETFNDTTYPNHKFRSYLASNKDIYVEHEIDANFGEHKHIHVDL